MVSLSICWKLPLYPMIPTSSKMDLPLAKAESISDGSSASELTHLRRKKMKLLCRRRLQPEKGGVKMCERNKSADTSQYEGGAEDAAGAGASIPLKYLVQSMVSSRLCLGSPWRCPVEQRSTCGEAHMRANGGLKEGCDL